MCGGINEKICGDDNMINYLGIVAIVLLIIIIYFFIRLRQMMKHAPGARSDMNTIDLIKNWQAQKAEDAQRQAELHERARMAAQPEIEETILERYKQEEITKATTPPGDKLKTTLKQGLGIDTDKVFGKENMDRLVGSRQVGGMDPGVDKNIFNQERISQMSRTNSNITPERIRQASGDLNWDAGVKRGLDSGTQFTGLDKALGRDRRRIPPRP